MAKKRESAADRFKDRFKICRHGQVFYFRDGEGLPLYLSNEKGVIFFETEDQAMAFADNYPNGTVPLIPPKLIPDRQDLEK